jgi:hypothetical protein
MMKTLTLDRRGVAPFAAILILAATTTLAEARMGGAGMAGMHGPTSTMPGNNPTMGQTRGHHYDGGWGMCYYNPRSCLGNPVATGGGGTTGGFTPGGGSGGLPPDKKPKFQ